MATTQHPVSSANSPRNLSYRMVFSRLFRSIFIGIAITLLLTAIELAMIWFFNPINILGDKRAYTFSILVALPMHLPLLLLIPFVELVAAALVAFLAARPLALRAYLRDVQKEQEAYRKTYTQLDSLAHMYKTPVTYFEHTPDPQLNFRKRYPCCSREQQELGRHSH
ncbi:MAG: hypothetical protein E6J04_13615 [Chloroflexi bacterium]|nr:MAG: hypothetical protein E6J04_13615 [Chloroflexota bacterium]